VKLLITDDQGYVYPVCDDVEQYFIEPEDDDADSLSVDELARDVLITINQIRTERGLDEIPNK